MKKRLLAMSLVLALVLSLMPAAAFATEQTLDYEAIIAQANAQDFSDPAKLPDWCYVCDQEVTWEPLDGGQELTQSGHYYLVNSVSEATSGHSKFTVQSQANVCLHMNGKTIESTSVGAAFNTWGHKTLNIMGGGKLIGNGSGWGVLDIHGNGATTNVFGLTILNNNANGRAMILQSGTVNLYNVTVEKGNVLALDRDANCTTAVNIYGGDYTNSTVSASPENNDVSVSIHAGSFGTVEASNDLAVNGGTVASLVGTADADRIQVSGNPVISALDLSNSPVKLTVGTLTKGARIYLGQFEGTVTEPFETEAAAQAAIPYFYSDGKSVTVVEGNRIAAGAVPYSASSYLVGYSKVDINPYAQDGTIMPIGLTGYGDDATRLALPNKLDDNGDGLVNEDDGIFATCIAITDKEGNTALLYGLDMLWGYAEGYGDDVLQTLLKSDEFKQYNLSADRIFFNGSHTHTAPVTDADSANSAQKAFNDILRNQLVAAARQALENRAWADMYRGSVDVSQYFNENNGARKSQKVGDLFNQLRAENGGSTIKEYTYAQYNGSGKDVLFNTVRHFKITEQKVKTNANGEPQTNLLTGAYVLDDTAQPVTYYAGNGFNGDHKNVGLLHEVYAVDPETGEILDGYPAGETKQVKEYRMITAWEPATETDDRLQLVQFRFDEDADRDPVVMINWRGHLPGGLQKTDDAYRTVSAGMVNALRYALQKSGYQAAFFQGQGGNINMEIGSEEGNWIRANAAEKQNIYGTELAQIALYALEEASVMTKINPSGDAIRSAQQIYQADYPRPTPFQYMAALRYRRALTDTPDTVGTRVYTDLYYYVDANGKPLIDANTGLPITTGKVGEAVYADDVVVITSADEARRHVVNYDVKGDKYVDMSLNAMTIGSDFSLVSATAELYDRYIGQEGENLWDTLAQEHNTHFVLGHTNAVGGGYLPDKDTYDFAASDNEITYVKGAAESNTARYAQGEGENVVMQMDAMLDFLEAEHPEGSTTTGNCPRCGENVTWIDLSREVSDGYLRYDNYIRSGHYYLPEGKTATLTYKQILSGETVCIDLNGQTLRLQRGLQIGADATLNIVDTKDTGCVIGSQAPQDGGLFCVKEQGNLTIDGGTYRYEGAPHAGQSSGGIVYVSGNFTLYDGSIEGSTVNFHGDAIHADNTGKLFLRGGQIKYGPEKKAAVTLTGQVTLSGDVNVDWLLLYPNEYTRLNIDGVFTGTVVASGMALDTAIGDAINGADTSKGYIHYQKYSLQIQDGKTYMREYTDFVAKNATTGEFIYGDYDALQNVLDTLPDGSRIVMLQNAFPTNVTYQVNQNLQWELKGQKVDTEINVVAGKTLEFTDCIGTGSVNMNKVNFNQQIQDEGVVYFPIDDQDHWARLNIDQLVLRADNKGENGQAEPGVYFKHYFNGDDVVKEQVTEYGIAFSLVENEDFETSLKAEGTLVYENSVVYRNGSVVYTKLDGASFGKSDADSTSTLITGIMKEENGAATNARNAQMPIYGVAYLKLSNGDVVLGEVRERSFQQQLEGVDTKWDELTHAQRKGVLKMYKVPTIKSVVDGWTVPNLQDPEKAQADTEKKVFRVLSIGNSHTDNATEYLYYIFQAENPNQEVQVAQLYYSGCTVDQHISFAAKNEAVYIYRTHDNRNPGEYTTMRQALNAEIWDVIILHEMNNAGAVKATYTGANKYDLQKHINYIKANCLNSNPKFIWNFSWANPTSQALWDLGYPADLKYNTFNWVEDYKKDYGPELSVMYGNMLEAMKTMTRQYVMTNGDISDVAPTGLAFKYARDKNPNQADPDVLLYGDYTHAGPGFGRLLAGYVWYATLTGQTEFTEIKYTRELTEDQQELLVEALNYALANKESLRP